MEIYGHKLNFHVFIVMEQREKRHEGIICICGNNLGVVSILLPEAMWQLYEGWEFKDAEPSDLALVMHRIGGGLLIVMAVLILLNVI